MFMGLHRLQIAPKVTKLRYGLFLLLRASLPSPSPAASTGVIERCAHTLSGDSHQVRRYKSATKNAVPGPRSLLLAAWALNSTAQLTGKRGITPTSPMPLFKQTGTTKAIEK